VALQECRSVSSQACALYAVDSEVVWKEPAADEPKQATATANHAKSSSAGSH
jgi:hypothetical protein